MSAITPILGPVEAYKAVVEILLQDEGVDAVAAVLLASPKVPAEEYSFLPELSARHPHKPIYVSFTGDKQAFDRARDFLENRSIPVFGLSAAGKVPKNMRVLGGVLMWVIGSLPAFIQALRS